jgi:hypothetical protein
VLACAVTNAAIAITPEADIRLKKRSFMPFPQSRKCAVTMAAHDDERCRFEVKTSRLSSRVKPFGLLRKLCDPGPEQAVQRTDENRERTTARRWRSSATVEM